MAQFQRVEGQVELKCHADKIFDLLACRAYLLLKISPKKFSKIELHEGDWDKVGAIYYFTYAMNDCELTLKAKVEELDHENKIIKYSYPCHDNFILKDYYTTLKSQMHAIPNGNKGCIVKWSMNYEKVNENAPPPNMYIDFLLDLAKDIDVYDCRA